MEMNPTKERIIQTATRLFAENGLDHVSMRQINVEAGQKNASALHYHFGSRLALIEAIFDYHMGPLNERRMKMMDVVEQEGRSGDLFALVSVKVLPVLGHITEHQGGEHYISFLAQALGNPDVRCRQIVGGRLDQGLVRALTHMITVLQPLPEAVVKQRFRMTTVFLLHGISDFLRYRKEFPEKRIPGDLENLFCTLIDMEIGALTAPVSDVSDLLEKTLPGNPEQGS